MKNALLPFLLLFMVSFTRAQYTEEWSDPLILTDSLSFNSNPVILNLETETYMFYEKKFTEDGPAKIYYRDIKNMGSEMEWLGNPDHSFRNPNILEFYYSNPVYCMLYEADVNGNFDLWAIWFDEFLNPQAQYPLTLSEADEINLSCKANTEFISWEQDGSILAAKLNLSIDTVFLTDITILDSVNCSDPDCSQSWILYSKIQEDSSSLYYCAWNYTLSQWEEPVALDTLGNNSYAHFSSDTWLYNYENCIVYEKEGRIFNFWYDELYELSFSGMEGEMHEPHSAWYDLAVDYLPAPLFVTFTSAANGSKDVYVYWSIWNEFPENVSNDSPDNSNPRFAWGWYAPAPCSRYFLDIWETTRNGYVTLDMSKCGLNICGSTNETEEDSDVIQIYPSPFHEKLKIRFLAESDFDVCIEIRNEAGQLLDKLNSGPVVSGWNEISYSPDRNIPAGILLITLKTGSRQLFRKVIYY